MNSFAKSPLFDYPFYSIKFIKKYFYENNINFKKSFGQNFIIDKNILEKFYNIFATYFNNKIVYEIGGGSGNLSWLLYNIAKKLVIFEIDNFFSKLLVELFENNRVDIFKHYYLDKYNANNNEQVLIELKNYLEKNKVKIIKGNFLNFDFNNFNDLKKDIEIKQEKINIFGNIPYNISSLIIKKLANNKKYFDNIILTTQKEYFDRLSADIGISGKNISYLTVFTKYHFKITKLLNIKRNSFYPVPKVESTTFILKPINSFSKIFGKLSIYKNDKINGNNYEEFRKNIENEFFKFISFCFTNKRKKTINSIKEYILQKQRKYSSKGILTKEMLTKIKKILENENIRSEEITIEKWGKIFEFIKLWN